MQSSSFVLTASDGASIHVHRWLPDGPARGVVQIAHGMAEHSARYARFAQALTDAGYAVYANDHRGHKLTAVTHEASGYFADTDGFRRVVRDMAELTTRAQEEQPDLPVVLFGHSMGSFLSRAYAVDYGSRLAGLVLSGTAGDPGALGSVGQNVAALEARIRGRKARSALMNKLSFGAYNGAFKPVRTEFDWLSRDEAEVDKYIADEWCGEIFTAGFWVDLLGGLGPINKDGVVARIPKALPVLIFSGEKDPVGGAKAVEEVSAQMTRVGLTNVRTKVYPGGRHEMLNETNRDEVTADVIAWLDTTIS